MHENLKALGGRSASDGRTSKRVLGHRHESLGVCGKRRRTLLPRPRGAAPFGVHRFLRRFERPQEQGAVIGRELCVDVQAAVIVVPVPPHKGTALRLVGLLGAHSSCSSHHPLQLGSGRMKSEFEEIAFALPIRDASEDSDL
jgi:hypothetical protein